MTAYDAFAEDCRVPEAVHASSKEPTSGHIDLAIDRPQLIFRKNLARLIAAEIRKSQAVHTECVEFAALRPLT
jgi:hypothetical protein